MKILGSVKYLGASESQLKWGHGDNPVEIGLQIGALYDVINIDVHSWHTLLTLDGVGGAYNSVLFSWADETPLLQAMEDWRKERYLR